MNDTDYRIERLYREMLRKKSPEERLRMGFSMFRFASELLLSSLNKESLSPEDLKQKVLLRLYGRNLKISRF